MAFDMPHEEPPDKVDYEAWELSRVIDELKYILEEHPAHEQEQNAIAVAMDGLDCLIESHKLLRHYASLLNQYDGGKRVIPDSVVDWIQRCKEVAEESASKEKQL